MKPTFRLRPVDIDRDLGWIAELFALEQDTRESEAELRADYEDHKARIFRLMVAEDEQGERLGFNWATRSRLNPNDAYLFVMVRPEKRGQGAGSLLYQDVERAARDAGIHTLLAEIRDNCHAYRAFAERFGFSEKKHLMGMQLNLANFDDRPFDELIECLQAEGFEFTSMEALGNTEEAQRKLYALNSTAAMQTLGEDGQPSWLSFEDFQKKVCQARWYIPAGQMVVIDTATGCWAAMSAITRFEGVDYAYNLFTGVDEHYRGRKLAQAVKALALRYARDVLKAATVRTDHNSKNVPMFVIDRKLGYTISPGLFTMQKRLTENAN